MVFRGGEMNKDAQQVFEALYELGKEGRQGTAAGAKASLTRALAAARSEGYAQAREMAAVLVAEWGDGEPLDIIYRRVRAMQDECAGEGRR